MVKVKKMQIVGDKGHPEIGTFVHVKCWFKKSTGLMHTNEIDVVFKGPFLLVEQKELC